MYLNSKDTGFAVQLITGIFESYTGEILKKNVSKGSVVCDVGAHIGYYTMLCSNLVGSSGKVYSFEPDSENFRLLRKNIQVNNLKNIYPEQIAVSDKKGTANLFISGTDSTDHRLVDPNNQKRKYMIVSQDSLDNLLKKEKRIDLIKIDIQGLEEKSLSGMRKLIKANNNISIIMEFWPEGLRQAGTKPDILLKKLIDYKLKIYLLDEEKRRMKRVKNIDTLLKLTGETGFVNLLCKGNK